MFQPVSFVSDARPPISGQCLLTIIAFTLVGDSTAVVEISTARLRLAGDTTENALSTAGESGALSANAVEVVESAHWFVNPETYLSEEFIRYSGLYPSMIQDAPLLAAVLPELAAFVGRDTILWVEPPKTNTALYRCFRLTQPRDKEVSMAAMAKAAGFTTRSSSLTAIARQAGLSTLTLDARSDSRLRFAAGLFPQLLALLQSTGMIQDWSQLPNLCAPPKAPRRLKAGRLTPFDVDRLRHYPLQPGVYFMKNRLGEILYIGKAKQLRVRLRSYFQNPRRLPPKIATLMQQVVTIEVAVVGSELEALLLEARMIKHHQPFFNRKIKNYQKMAYMRLSVSDAFPRLTVSHLDDDPHAVHYGPFSGAFSVRATQEIMNRVFQLRDCSDAEFEAHADGACVKAQLGACSGPCAGLIDADAYQIRVMDFVEFLAGQTSYTVEGLIAKRDAYAESLAFEKAAALQERLSTLEQLQLRQYRLLRAIAEHNAILILPGHTPNTVRLLTLLHGQPLAWLSVEIPALLQNESNAQADHNAEPVALSSTSALAVKSLPYGVAQVEVPLSDSVSLQSPAVVLFVANLLDELATAASKTLTSRKNLDKALFEEARLISQWLYSPKTQSAQVIFCAERSLEATLDILWERLSVDTDTGRLKAFAVNLSEAVANDDETGFQWEETAPDTDGDPVLSAN